MLQSLRSTDCRLLQGADAKPTVKFLYPRFLFLFLFFQITFEKKRVGQPNTTQPKCSSAGALLTACAPLSLESSRTLVRCFGGGGGESCCSPLPPQPSNSTVGAGGLQQELVPGGALARQSLLALGLFWVMGSFSWASRSVLE